MRILLVSANPLTHPHPVYPMGLDCVAAALSPTHEVHRTDVLELAAPGDAGTAGSLSADPGAPARAARALAPDVIGVALRNIDNTDATDTQQFIAGYRDLVASLREACPAATVVLGGAGFTIAPEAILAQVGGDAGILGEGERLAALVDALARGGDGRGLPGVLYPGEAPEMPPPLERLPPVPAPADPAPLAPYLARGAILNLQTKRGCPYRCSYCTYPHLEGRTLRHADPEAVAARARDLQAAGARFLFVTDAAFNADEAHGVAVAEALRRAGVTVPWGAFFAPRTRDPGYWQALADCGLSHVEFGTEALSPRLLEALRKPFSVPRALQAHRAALDAGLHVAHYFMLGGPTEDEASVRETFTAARDLERTVCFFFAGIRLLPGTALYDQARAEGQLAADADPLEPRFYEPAALPLTALHRLMAEQTKGSARLLLGAGGERVTRVMQRMYDLGHTGPLWERLIG